MPTKKIFLIRNVAPEQFGGAETYQLKIAKKLKCHGLEPVILTNSKKLLKEARTEGFKTFVPPYIGNQNWSGLKNFFLPLYYLKLASQRRWYERLFNKERPIAVNIQSRDDWLSATEAAQKLNTKIIWTDHADFRNWVLWNVRKKLKNPIGKKIMKFMSIPEKVVLISETEKNWLASTAFNNLPANITVIHSGVVDELKNYKNNPKPKKGSFIYHGRITHEKGINELLEAFKEISSRFTDVSLNLYGDGKNLESYRVVNKEFKNIVFHGVTYNPLKALAANEVFILPSHNEGLSLSMLEAAMMQKTIIATDVGAAREVIEHEKSGLLVQPKSVKALASAMKKVLSDQALASTMAKNARKHFETEFDLDKIFEEKMLPLYQENVNG